MSVSFGGIGELAVTFKTSGTVKKGDPVKIAENGAVATCSAADRFCGVALDVAADGYATIQLEGYVTMTYSGSGAPTLGYCKLEAAADSTVAVSTGAGGEYLVVDVDTTAKTVGFYM